MWSVKKIRSYQKMMPLEPKKLEQSIKEEERNISE
jgi:hypothetical protein